MTIKNEYSLFLVRESLDQLGWAWYFIQLNFTNAFYQIRIKEGNK